MRLTLQFWIFFSFHSLTIIHSNMEQHGVLSNMEQNLSLYEDSLHFYLVISSDNGELSENMQYAREVCMFHLLMLLLHTHCLQWEFFVAEKNWILNNFFRNLKRISQRTTSRMLHRSNVSNSLVISQRNTSSCLMNSTENVLRLSKKHQPCTWMHRWLWYEQLWPNVKWDISIYLIS